MAYDAWSESVALIASRHLVRVERLSRRRRFVAMSVDVDDDLAVTSFARRGVGCVWHDTHVLVRREGHWVLLGGSGSSSDLEDLLADRPQVLTDGSDAVDRLVPDVARTRSVLPAGTGGVHDSGGGADRWPWSGRWVSWSQVRASAAVQSLTLAGRVVPVPWHGRAVVVWTGRRGPLVAAHDRDGRRIGEVLLRRRTGPPGAALGQ